MEQVVAAEYERLRGQFPSFCGCAICRDDVMVYALNRLEPRYVTERRGAVLQHIALQQDQPSADIAVALMAGFRVVGQSPRSGHQGKAGTGT